MFKKISKESICESLSGNTRQYLTGRLQKSQILEHVDDEKLEIGITLYDDYHSELPHTHSQAYEYQYMLSGFTTYLDIDTKEEISFREGDFYVITPGTKYAQKSKPDTTILFIKVPPGNDKVNIQPDDFISRWLEEKIKTVRSDFTNDLIAPRANSVKPAVAVALFDFENNLLLLRRKDSGKWTMPGGTLEFGESLAGCGVREIKEETGYEIEIINIIGTYTNPSTVVAYSDGEVRQEFTIVYEGKIVSGYLKLDNESTEYKWLNLANALDIPLAESQRTRLMDVIEYKRTRKIFLR
jgi:8-oxo-dGTP diphosphatase